jgi:HSP20 family protein
MAFKDIVPWRKQTPTPANPADYFTSFREQMDRLFDDFWGGRGFRVAEPEVRAFLPNIEVSEDKESVKVTAELPGLSEKDVQLTLAANGEQLIIRGEKKFEEERKEENFYRCERSYGSFHRAVGLPTRVNTEKVDATFKDGVLTVKMVKLPEVEAGTRQIPIGK